MVFQLARFLCVTGLALSTQAFATETFTHLPQILGSDQSFDHLQRAYQTVHQDRFVQKLLRDGETNALSISSRIVGYGVETTKFQHFYKGLEVMGSMTFHHASNKGMEVRNVINRFDLDTRPGITSEAAVAIAKSVAGDHELTRSPELKILPSNQDHTARLIYWVDLDNQGLAPGADVLVDAQTGALIANISKLDTLAQVQVLTAQNQGVTLLPLLEKNPLTGSLALVGCQVKDLDTGKITKVTVAQCKAIAAGKTDVTIGKCQVVLLDLDKTGAAAGSGDPIGWDPASCLQVVKDGVATDKADPSARNAQDNATKVLNYYRDVHGRDGFDNAGSDVVNVVHIGQKYANAAWVRGLDFMLYGDGDGELMGDMTKGLDVAGHELTHGITSKTAKLTSMDESGALNEAYSDFFGKVIANDGSWVVGASLSLNPVLFPGIRDMANPHSIEDEFNDATGARVTKPYPAKRSEAQKKLPSTTCDKSNDRCWVHYNSTVPSHASYLIYQAIGAQKTEALYYLTLTQYLGSEANFAKAAEATLAACKVKFDEATCTKVREIFVQTEMMK